MVYLTWKSGISASIQRHTSIACFISVSLRLTHGDQSHSRRKLGSQQTIWTTTVSTDSRSSQITAAHFISSSSGVVSSRKSTENAWKDMLRLARSTTRHLATAGPREEES